jgi:thiamine-monophosphate kinase
MPAIFEAICKSAINICGQNSHYRADSMGEFELIERYFKRPVARARLGVGDDCALLTASAGCELAVSTDMLVEGRHFLPCADAGDAYSLGHKALAVNLSDLAACGATPLAFTLALALPDADEPWLAGFASGLFALADRHHIELIGGDTTRSVMPLPGSQAPQLKLGAGPVVIAITVLGEVPNRQALLRSGAQPGDDIWVSGELGDARLALGRYLGEWPLDDAIFNVARRRMHQPTPRVALGCALRGIATSAIDVSDGFLGDLRHVLQRSGAGARIDADTLPRSAGLSAQPLALQRLCTLAGGDDYELIFTAPPASRSTVLQVAASTATPVTHVGVVNVGSSVTLLDAHGAVIDAAFASFDHFA